MTNPDFGKEAKRHEAFSRMSEFYNTLCSFVDPAGNYIWEPTEHIPITGVDPNYQRYMFITAKLTSISESVDLMLEEDELGSYLSAEDKELLKEKSNEIKQFVTKSNGDKRRKEDMERMRLITETIVSTLKKYF